MHFELKAVSRIAKDHQVEDQPQFKESATGTAILTPFHCVGSMKGPVVTSTASSEQHLRTRPASQVPLLLLTSASRGMEELITPLIGAERPSLGCQFESVKQSVPYTIGVCPCCLVSCQRVGGAKK
jgi:hypothetical protein